LDKNDYLSDDVFSDGFYIPENVYIIGTMNDIDRSVESMDFALRRRFVWKEIKVTEDLLKDAIPLVLEGILDKENSEAKNIVSGICKLNETIKDEGSKYGLNEQYFISQGQFANLPFENTDENTVMEFVWKYRIEPLLREYVRGERDIEAFITKCEDACKGAVENSGEGKSNNE
jgi:5-methylcytosine-specific restriction endonuclease McrBC GTP-binding regulatory subunit McrB